MKIEEIKLELTNNYNKDVEIIYNHCNEEITDDESGETIFNLATIMYNIAIEKIKDNEKYIKKYMQVKVAYFAYLMRKITLKNSKKEWQSLINYADKAIKVENYKQYVDGTRCYQFSNLFESYIYRILYSDNQKISWCESATAIIYKKKGDAYYNLLNIDSAIDCYNKSFDFNPMLFDSYIGILNCLVKVKNYKQMIDVINKAYNICYLQSQIAYLLYFYAQYFIGFGNLQLARNCILVLSAYPMNSFLQYRTVELIDKINSYSNVVLDVFQADPVEILRNANIQCDISIRMKAGAITFYRFLLNNPDKEKNSQNYVKNLLINEYKMDLVEQQVRTNVNENMRMYIFANLHFTFNITNDWKVITYDDNLSATNGNIFLAKKDNFDLSINLLTNRLDVAVEQAYNADKQRFIDLNCDITEFPDFCLIPNRNIKYLLVSTKDASSSFIAYYTKLTNKLYGRICITVRDDIKEKREILLKVINSIIEI